MKIVEILQNPNNKGFSIIVKENGEIVDEFFGTYFSYLGNYIKYGKDEILILHPTDKIYVNGRKKKNIC